MGQRNDSDQNRGSDADVASAAPLAAGELPPAPCLQQLVEAEVAEVALRFEQVLASLALPAAAEEEMRGFDAAKKRQLVAMHSAGKVAAAAAAAAFAAGRATGGGAGGVGGVAEQEKHAVLSLRLICGRELPKPNEQCCVAELHDRLHPASVFGKRPTSCGGISAVSVTVEVHGGGRFRGAVPLRTPFTQGAVYSSAVATGGGQVVRIE